MVLSWTVDAVVNAKIKEAMATMVAKKRLAMIAVLKKDKTGIFVAVVKKGSHAIKATKQQSVDDKLVAALVEQAGKCSNRSSIKGVQTYAENSSANAWPLRRSR